MKANLQDLHARLYRRGYRALASRRRYIPNADGRCRPLGITALEDKIVQAAVAAILTPIYEAEFLGFRFRPERVSVMRLRMGWEAVDQPGFRRGYPIVLRHDQP